MDDPAIRIRRYRSRAEELRTLADGWRDATCRVSVLDMARDYEQLAEALENGQEPDLRVPQYQQL